MLEKIDLSQRLDDAEYDRRKKRLQASLHQLGFQIYQQKRPCVIAFEGSDAAGKGGAIKRLTGRLDPRGFEERERIDYKAWKLTDEDWRNRGKWEDYQQAAEDMLLKTSTPNAPWTVVEANDKPFARVKVMETVEDALQRALS